MITINIDQVRAHIKFNSRTPRFEFRLFPKHKSTIDVDYYPIVTPQSMEDLSEHIVSTICKLIEPKITKIENSENRSPMDIIILDELCQQPDTQVKTYFIFNGRNRVIGMVNSSATGETLNEVILTHFPNAQSYEEV